MGVGVAIGVADRLVPEVVRAVGIAFALNIGAEVAVDGAFLVGAGVGLVVTVGATFDVPIFVAVAVVVSVPVAL